MEKIYFKYHPDPLKTGAFKNDKTVQCYCCKEQTNIYYTAPFYSEEQVDYLCPECISSGFAAEVFDGQFVDDACVDEVSDPAKLDELIHRTPCYQAYQQEDWFACCDDYCAFEGYVTWEDIERLGIEKEVEETYRDDVCMIPFDDAKEMLQNGGEGYLFTCLHCGKHYLNIDVD